MHIEWSDSEPEDVNKVIWSKEKMLTAHRKFNIDLSPKVYYMIFCNFFPNNIVLIRFFSYYIQEVNWLNS